MRESEGVVLLNNAGDFPGVKNIKLDAQTGSADPFCCKNQKCDHLSLLS